MIHWSSIQFGAVWPVWFAAGIFFGLAYLWFARRQKIFPDLALITHTRPWHGLGDLVFTGCGCVLFLVLIVVLMKPAVTVIENVQQNARDFLILVDTSRSMRHDTSATRSEHQLHFPRRVGAFSDAVADPGAMPRIARFEVARESLLRFLADRHPGDRVSLTYFNDDVHPVSALTSNLDFIIDQLGLMDDYVNWGTDIAAAFDSGLNLLERYPGENKRALILITDAESRFTQDLENQFGRLAAAGISFHLLWITADAGEAVSDDARQFTQLAASVGNVFAVFDPDPANIQDALTDIGNLESYDYERQRQRTLNIAQPLLVAGRFGFLAWLLLGATIFHPALSRRSFGVSPQ